jgi:hypothetical protein
VNTKIIEGLFASDLNYLQKLYEELNSDEPYQAQENNSPEIGRTVRQSMEFGVVGEA